MRAFVVMVMAAGFFGGEARGEVYRLADFGELPRLSKEWVVWESGTNRGTATRGSWLVFTNSATGDWLSFLEVHLGANGQAKVNRVPWSNWAGDSFPGGYPLWNRPANKRFSVQWIRNEVREIGVVDQARGTNIIHEVLECTLLFEPRQGTNGVRLAHSYAAAPGPLQLLVQHTSLRAITPDLAQELISGMLWAHQRKASPDISPRNDLCKVCGAAVYAGGDAGFDADGLDTPARLFHHYGLHGHEDFWLVRVDGSERTGGGKGEARIEATLAASGRGARQAGEKVAFTRYFEGGGDGELAALRGKLYYVLVNDSGEKPRVDPQNPLAFREWSAELGRVVEGHEALCIARGVGSDGEGASGPED